MFFVILSVLLMTLALAYVGHKDMVALFAILFWVLVKLPIAMICFSLGVIFCASLVLIPIGEKCFNMVKELLIAE